MNNIYENIKCMQDILTGRVHGIEYTVVKGDTLYELACRYHVSVNNIICANPDIDVYRLTPGKVLIIPTVYDETFS